MRRRVAQIRSMRNGCGIMHSGVRGGLVPALYSMLDRFRRPAEDVAEGQAAHA
jgi:hypothetical protein